MTVPRRLWIAIAMLAVLLIVAIVVMVMILNEMNAQQAQEAYLNCMALRGYYPDKLNSDLTGMLAAATACGR